VGSPSVLYVKLAGLPGGEPLLRCGATAEPRVDTQRVPKLPLIVAIHDDVQVCGPPDQVARALRHLLQSASERCGLTPAGHKFTLYCPGARPYVPEG
jgi:hypothetical protein